MADRSVSLALPKPHVGQQRVISEASRFNVVCCGRRWGKTTMGVNRSIDTALKGDPAGWFAPTYKVLTDVWRNSKRLLQPVTSRVSEQEHRIDLITGGIIEMWSLEDPDASRGRAYARVSIDEAARVQKLRYVWNEVLRATLADYVGDAWFYSTPRGMNYFYTLWSMGQDPNETEWKSWKTPTSENPYIAKPEIESARRGLPAIVFAQEYLAEFLPDAAGTVFRKIDEAAVLTPIDAPTTTGKYIISIDWAKVRDWTVLSVWDITTNSLVHMDRFQQIDYTLQMNRLKALCSTFNPIALAPEQNSVGDPLIEKMAREPWCPQSIFPFTTTNASKAVAVEAFSLALETGAVKFIDDPVLIAELQSFESVRTPSGMFRYQAPEGMHDDCVMSAIIGWWTIIGGDTDESTNRIIYDDPVEVSPY